LEGEGESGGNNSNTQLHFQEGSFNPHEFWVTFQPKKNSGHGLFNTNKEILLIDWLIDLLERV
jgi:hypothetical protein